HTLYRNIRSVQAGSFVWVEQDNTPKSALFCSIPEIFAEHEHGDGHGSVNEDVREALRDTVRRHLIADVPVGVFLSSGVDSTIVAALAAEEGGTLQTVTLGFDEYKGTPNDEAPLAEEVARLYGSEHRTVRVTRRDFEDRFDDLMSVMDQPTIDGINSYWVSRAAQEAGLKVALSGLGGDELFGGYPSFHQVPKLVRFLRPFDALKPLGRGFRLVAGPILKSWTSPKYAGLFEYGGSYP